MAFIPSYVKIRTRAQGGNLPDHIVYKTVYGVLSGIQSTETHGRACIYFRGFAISIKEWVGYGCCIGMPWHIHFRYNGDKAFAGKVYQFLVFFLCIIATRTTSYLCLAAYLRQFRPGFNFDPPSLIICEVEVQDIDFIIGQHFHVFLHIFHGEKVPRYI